ncbi:hypothetical protein KUTeg_022775, partial [Tegillarca granosa]
MTSNGVNWAKELPKYASTMNVDAKEELNWKTPFKIYYGRRNNQLVFPADNSSSGKHAVWNEKHDCNYMPRENDRISFCKNRKQWHKSAKTANARCAERMIKRALKQDPPSIYKRNDKVLVRMHDDKHHEPRRHKIIPGVIIMTNLKLHRYKVRTVPDKDKQKQIVKWFSVKDITSETKAAEGQRVNRRKTKLHRQKYYIVKSHADNLGGFKQQIRYDPPGDGNCQFSAIADQLSVNRLGIHLSNFVDNNNFMRYLRQMQKDGNYGDHITLQRVSEMYNMQIIVYSTLGPQATRVISPTGRYEPNLPNLYLGHFAEGHGDHYVSLEALDNDIWLESEGDIWLERER